MKPAPLFEGRSERSVHFSPDRRYRYRLSIIWDQAKRPLPVVMLNPSTADEFANDPTVERIERRARSLELGGVVILNLFAFRATDPKDMFRAVDPIGPENDAVIREELYVGHAFKERFPPVLVGWGVHGSHLVRDRAVASLIHSARREAVCLGTTRGGQPRHPLYVGYAVPFQPWSPKP